MYSEDNTSTDASRWLDAQVEGLPEPSPQWPSEDNSSTDASRWLDAQVGGLPEPSAQWPSITFTDPSGGQHQAQDPEMLEMYEHVLRGDSSVFDAADISGFPSLSAQNASSAFGTDLPATFFDPNSTPYFNGIEPQLAYGGASIPNVPGACASYDQQHVPFSSNPEEWRMDERVPQGDWSTFNFDTGFATLPNPSSLYGSGTQLQLEVHPGHQTSNLGTVADGSASGPTSQAPLKTSSRTDMASKQGVSPDGLALDRKLLRADPRCRVISDTDTSVFCVYCNKFVELRDKRCSLLVAWRWHCQSDLNRQKFAEDPNAAFVPETDKEIFCSLCNSRLSLGYAWRWSGWEEHKKTQGHRFRERQAAASAHQSAT